MYQDNMATMCLEINGSLYSSKCTNHIKARYILIKDKVDSGEIEIEHCPTEIMWVDVLSKPKGGRPFCLDCSYLMNVYMDYYNDIELLKTHPDLLPEADSILENSRRISAPVCHRSMSGNNAIAYFQSA